MLAITHHKMGSEVITVAKKMLILVFSVVMLCGLEGRYQHFGGTYCLHLQPSFSKMLVSTFKSTWHYNPEDQQPTSTPTISS
jgi:hypothetical protein